VKNIAVQYVEARNFWDGPRTSYQIIVGFFCSKPTINIISVNVTDNDCCRSLSAVTTSQTLISQVWSLWRVKKWKPVLNQCIPFNQADNTCKSGSDLAHYHLTMCTAKFT